MERSVKEMLRSVKVIWDLKEQVYRLTVLGLLIHGKAEWDREGSVLGRWDFLHRAQVKLWISCHHNLSERYQPWARASSLECRNKSCWWHWLEYEAQSTKPLGSLPSALPKRISNRFQPAARLWKGKESTVQLQAHGKSTFQTQHTYKQVYSLSLHG